jgi:predicted transcriptional regulator
MTPTDRIKYYYRRYPVAWTAVLSVRHGWVASHAVTASIIDESDKRHRVTKALAMLHLVGVVERRPRNGKHYEYRAIPEAAAAVNEILSRI